MEKKIYPLYYSGEQMTWAKGAVVKGAKGFVWLAGAEGRKPEKWNEIVGGAEAQTRMCLEKIKSNLEEMGSSLENIIKIIYYIAGREFPDGVAKSPTYIKARKVINEFFKEHCPEFCFDKQPLPNDLIGVAGLAHKDMLIEIVVIAALPD